MLFVSIVLDGVGIGAQDDADRYGDAGSHTLGHVCAAAHPDLPHLARLGLGRIDNLEGVTATDEPTAHFGRMREISAGKDSTTGHWELAGLRLDEPFPTYPDGFPDEVVDAFCEKAGLEGVLGNEAASGTEIVSRLGEEHQRTGQPILYTSADSVFQLAAHTDTIPLDELYRLCEVARQEICVDEHAVGRVIARPFVGEPGSYERVSSKRRDFSRQPERAPIQEVLRQHGVRTEAVGKIGDLFAGVGFDAVHKTRSNEEGVATTLARMEALAEAGQPAFLWTNLVDFDQDYGHRNDPDGFARALEAFDRRLPDLLDALPDGGVLVLTADHGNDPTTPSTDHSREHVPLLVVDRRPPAPEPGRDLGLRPSFNDHAATLAAFFGATFATDGTPFLP